jgi:hypothetical protein
LHTGTSIRVDIANCFWIIACSLCILYCINVFMLSLPSMIYPRFLVRPENGKAKQIFDQILVLSNNRPMTGPSSLTAAAGMAVVIPTENDSHTRKQDIFTKEIDRPT